MQAVKQENTPEERDNLKILEDASMKMYTGNQGYEGGVIKDGNEIVSFDLTDGYKVLMLPPHNNPYC